MDLVLECLDTYVFDRLYANLFPRSTTNNIPSSLSKTLHVGNYSLPLDHGSREIYGSNTVFFAPSEYMTQSMFPRDHILRQFASLFFIVWFFGVVLYMSCAAISYYFIFDKRTFNHPKYLKNQVKLEINLALSAIPGMSLLTVPWFVLEIRGYGKLYWNLEDWGWPYLLFQFPLFIMFTDCGIYYIHRWLHIPFIYKTLHKPHHKWIVCTPFASHSFHPIDGYAQSLPYHMFPFLFPLHKLSYLFLLTFINIWTVLIHDGEFLTANPIINSTACHTVHHLYFNYNYGQFTTLWDRLGGSYRAAESELWDKDIRNSKTSIRKQLEETEKIRMELEQEEDFREYNESKLK